MPRFTPLGSETVSALRAGNPDAHGKSAARAVAGGPGTPCRCCLRDIEPARRC